MIEYAHGFRMNEEACDGCLACILGREAAARRTGPQNFRADHHALDRLGDAFHQRVERGAAKHGSTPRRRRLREQRDHGQHDRDCICLGQGAGHGRDSITGYENIQ